MIRVGFDARWYSSSGVGTYVVNLLNSLGSIDDGDFEVFVYENPQNPVPVASRNLHKRIIQAQKYSVQEQFELARLCWTDRLDVFHSPFYIVPFFASCPIVATVHDLMAFLFPLYGFVHQNIVRVGYRTGVRKARRVIAVSDTTARDLMSLLHVPAEKITRVYNGYSKSLFHNQALPDEREYLRRRFGITSEYVLTLSAGNWRTKNLRGALGAMAIAEHNSPVPFQSVIVGLEDGYRAAQFAGQLHNPVVTGFVLKEDLPKLYRNASAFLSVSSYEGFGLPLVEAMACGCPCIVSTGGSLPEIAGTAAQKFGCDDHHGMAIEIIHLLGDPTYRKLRGQKSLERAALFSCNYSAIETLKVYRELAASKSNRFRLA